MKLIKFDIHNPKTYPEFEREDYLCLSLTGEYFICRWLGTMWTTHEIVSYYCELPDIPDEIINNYNIEWGINES